jgi:NAD(P)-dependent dehydrogenase (short-subunit alcohol dehydrogenase family)
VPPRYGSTQPALPVYAPARHVDDLSDLVAKDVTTLALDLTDAESMDVAVKRISAEHGAVGILVNNAGYAELGTIEEIALDDARVQLETNVLGPAHPVSAAGNARTTLRADHQPVLHVWPVRRARTGIYHASKYALEGLKR